MLTPEELAQIKAMLVERREKIATGVSAAAPIYEGLRLVAEVERMAAVVEAARGVVRLNDPDLAATSSDGTRALTALIKAVWALDGVLSADGPTG